MKILRNSGLYSFSIIEVARVSLEPSLGFIPTSEEQIKCGGMSFANTAENSKSVILMQKIVNFHLFVKLSIEVLSLQIQKII